MKGKNAITGLITFPTNKGDGWDRPILCKEKVFQFGDAIAIVAADTEEHARAAAEKVKVELEVLPCLYVGLRGSGPRCDGNPSRHAECRRRARCGEGRGNQAAHRRAKAVVDITTYCSRHPHLHLEPDCGVAYIDDDGVLVIQSKSIAVHLHHAMIAPGLGVPAEKLRLIQNPRRHVRLQFSPTMEALLGVAALATGSRCRRPEPVP